MSKLQFICADMTQFMEAEKEKWGTKCYAYIAALYKELLFVVDDIKKLEAERDEADRRAGAAERELVEYKDDVLRLNRVRDQQKTQAGYHVNTSFDVVWKAALDALKKQPEYIKAIDGINPDTGYSYETIRGQLSKLSGVPMMAITTDEHIERIRLKLEGDKS